jgi:4'-phosphopantetheinyl transferase
MSESLSLTNVVSTLSYNWTAWDCDRLMPELSHHSIHLWAFDMANLAPDVFDDSTLEVDRSRAARIINQEKRKLYLGGRAGLRILLSRYTGLNYKTLRFGYGHRGKPLLLNDLDGATIDFNYTLSKNKVLYAVSLDRQLGVDMEVLPRSINANLMAERKLTAAEQCAWRGLPSTLSNDSMLCCWTRKEAYGKTIGVGVRFNLAQVNLFDRLGSSYWQTDLTGLFEHTDQEGMPAFLEGVQLGLPFDAVASLMYEIDICMGDRPTIRAMQLTV